jgi:hypothetical protein
MLVLFIGVPLIFVDTVLNDDVKEHQMPPSTDNVPVMFKNIVCLLSDFYEYPVISIKLPILVDDCFVFTFQEQSKETIESRLKQNE